MKIKSILAQEILDSRGSPTIETKVYLDDGSVGWAAVPTGASIGEYEAIELRDGDPKRYNGLGVLKAIENVTKKIAPTILGLKAGEQRKIDQKLIDLDGTSNKSKLGGNAILSVSLAVARAAAQSFKLPLYRYLRQVYSINSNKWLMPRPMVVMIEGGKHADNTTDLQEFLVCGLRKDLKASENIRIQMEIYVALKKILKREGLSINVGNEGAFAPDGISDNEKPLKFLLEAIKNAGYKPGIDVGLSIDAAASEFFNQERKKYTLKLERKEFSSEELIGFYKPWVEKYPIVTMEDMLSEFDWDNWPKLVKVFGDKVTIIADDLTVTNIEKWQKAIKMKAATAILIKLNQVGTLSETIDCCLLAQKHNLATIPSHRGGGETNDTFMVDLGVAVSSDYIKVGPTRGERVCKYNRLMEIEKELDDKAVYSQFPFK